jgi:predicted amidohydrolase
LSKTRSFRLKTCATLTTSGLSNNRSKSCVSAQWPTVRKGHWELLNAARAVENQLFVVAANAVGKSGDFRFSGGSLILSPAGERLAAGGGEEGLAMAVIDPAQVAEVRRRIPCAQDRNERAYRKTRQKR